MKSPFPKYNVIMIGDSATGKSSILLRLIYDKLFIKNKINSTIGVDFGVKLIELNNSKKTIKLHIWDTAGHERYRTILNSYYNKGDAVILVFDVTNKTSFQNLNSWIVELNTKSNKNIPLFIVANKTDLNPTFEYLDLIKTGSIGNQNFIKFYEVSAYNGININNLFYDIAEYMDTNINVNDNTISLNEKIHNKKNCCS